MKTHIVEKDDDGIRLDRWFHRHYPEVSFTLIAKLLRKKQIKLDGQKASPNQRISANQQITFRGALFSAYAEPSPKKHGTQPAQKQEKSPALQAFIKKIKERIIYKDDNLIAINKPVGAAVQGGTKVAVSIADILGELRFGSDLMPKIVHRLDKGTSGVLLLARNNTTAAALGDLFKRSKVAKRYLAIVVGVPRRPSGVITFPIAKASHNGTEVIQREEEAGKEAITKYTLLGSTREGLSLIEFEPLTGRKHQIRIHAALMGWPILGDDKYGSRLKKAPNGGGSDVTALPKRLYLHAEEISFILNGEKISISASSNFTRYVSKSQGQP